MLRGTVVPRFPWGIPPFPIRGVPGAPYLEPLELPQGMEALDAVSLCWGCAVQHIAALHTLYLGAGHSRVTERLLGIINDISAVLSRRAPHRVTPFLVMGTRGGEEALDVRGALVATSEAGWWAVAAQASFALSAWYGLHEDSDPDAEIACRLHRVIRAGMGSMYGDTPANRILDLATGDGAGDLLKLVAQVHVGLEVRP